MLPEPLRRSVVRVETRRALALAQLLHAAALEWSLPRHRVWTEIYCAGVLARLAHLIVRRRRLVIGVWIVLTLFGAFSAGAGVEALVDAVLDPGLLGVRGEPADAEDLRHRRAGAARRRLPQRSGDVTKQRGIATADRGGAGGRIPARASARTSRPAATPYVSKDRHTTFAEIYPGRDPGLQRERSHQADAGGAAGGGAAGRDREPHRPRPARGRRLGGGGGPSILTEALIGGLGALVILFFVFGTLPAVLMPIAIAIASILNTFTLVWILTYVTNVSIIVQFLIALVGLGVAIDYALLMIFRFRDELREGEDVETALVETMTHAGRSVIVSGSTVAVGLLSMVILPLPFIRSIGIGGMLIPAVSVLAAITLLPALLSRARHAHQQRARAAEALRRHAAIPRTACGAAGRASSCAGRCRSAPSGSRSSACCSSSGCSSTRARRRRRTFPGTGDAIDGRDGARRRRHLARRDEAVRRARRARRDAGADRGEAAATPGDRRRVGADAAGARTATRSSRRSRASDGAAKPVRATIDRDRRRARGHGRNASAASRRRTATSCTPSTANFPYVLAFVILLTYHPARARVPVARAAAEGRDPEPRLARRGLRDHRLHLPAGPRLGGDLERARDAVDHPVDPADDLRVPVRPLDGLRGLHAHAHARGLRRDGRHERRRSRSGSRAPASSSRAPRSS